MLVLFSIILNLFQSECVDKCVGKHMKVNHKIMSVYTEVQPIYMQRRLDEMMAQAQAAEAQMEQMQAAAAAEAAPQLEQQ